jgi:crotonobetainyl-CoA:carnitine CoA-transferase CaiB-like acyl-CoA transferase
MTYENASDSRRMIIDTPSNSGATRPLPLEGVRVLEVAIYGLVPSAGAILAEWGAEVIKVEHVAGEAMPNATTP